MTATAQQHATNLWTQDLTNKYNLYVFKRNKINRTGRSSTTDSDKTKVYQSEWAFISKWKAAGNQIPQYANYDEARKALTRILNTETWKKLNTNTKTISIVEKKKMYNSVTAGLANWNGSIQLCPIHGMNLYTLIHELAHQAGNMHHDVSFRKTLLKLVSRFMGTQAATMLKKEFMARKLRMTRHQTIMSPEQWLAAHMKVTEARKSLTYFPH